MIRTQTHASLIPPMGGMREAQDELSSMAEVLYCTYSTELDNQREGKGGGGRGGEGTICHTSY